MVILAVSLFASVSADGAFKNEKILVEKNNTFYSSLPSVSLSLYCLEKN
jgi:hypothetical protein